jgi:hypothetical protein
MTDDLQDLESAHPNLELTEIAYDAHHADFQKYPKFKTLSGAQRRRWSRGLFAAIEARDAGQPFDVEASRNKLRHLFASTREFLRQKQPYLCWAPFFVNEAEATKVHATNAGFAACRYFSDQFGGFLGAGDDGIVLVRDEADKVHRIKVFVKLVATAAPEPGHEELLEAEPASEAAPEPSEHPEQP